MRLPTPSHSYLNPQETDQRKICDAVNNVSQRAFCQDTYFKQGTDGNQLYNSTTWVLVTGMTIELTVPVPSLTRVSVALRSRCATYAAGEQLEVKLYRDGVAINSTTQAWQPGGSDEELTIPFFWVDTDLLPETTYTYGVYARVASYAASVFRVNGTASMLMIETDGIPRI